MTANLLEIDDLTVQYETQSGPITAVSDANVTVEAGEYFGLVGESGCGKSTLVKSIVGGLDSNGTIPSGSIRYDGRELVDLSDDQLNEDVRWKEITYIPQSSMNSLNPLERISKQAVTIARTHTDLTKREALEQFEEMFEIVGLPPERITDYPHQFSGGMKQRATIALALFLEPSLIIADEPTTALDVIMQDQVFKYLEKVQERQETSLLLITHDISVVFETCDRMAVMHGGQVAETGTVENVHDEPRHPYSILLQRAFPTIENRNEELEVIEGAPPQLGEDVDFCSFVDRCPWAAEECHERAPPLETVGETDGERAHSVGCLRWEEIQQGEATQ